MVSRQFGFLLRSAATVSALALALLPPVSAQTTASSDAVRLSAKVTARRAQVLDFLRKRAGHGTVVGLENKGMANPTSDIERLTSLTGKAPGLWGADFGFGHGAVDQRQNLVDEAERQWHKGALVSLMFHTCAPTGDEFCGWDDIGGKHPVHLTDAQWQQLMTAGTPLHANWIARLDAIAPFLQQLRQSGVVVLFRPFHEMNQCVFWWGCHTGAGGTAALYEFTRDYLTRIKGLDNIVWVWNVQDFATLAKDVETYRPPVFDVASLDVYETSGFTIEKYHLLLDAARGKPIAIGECRYYPTSDELRAEPRWVYSMLWPDFIADNAATAPALFAAPNVITLSGMPGWQ